MLTALSQGPEIWRSVILSCTSDLRWDYNGRRSMVSFFVRG